MPFALPCTLQALNPSPSISDYHNNLWAKKITGIRSWFEIRFTNLQPFVIYSTVGIKSNCSCIQEVRNSNSAVVTGAFIP